MILAIKAFIKEFKFEWWKFYYYKIKVPLGDIPFEAKYKPGSFGCFMNCFITILEVNNKKKQYLCKLKNVGINNISRYKDNKRWFTELELDAIHNNIIKSLIG